MLSNAYWIHNWRTEPENFKIDRERDELESAAEVR
jgi:hypothetical protein